MIKQSSKGKSPIVRRVAAEIVIRELDGLGSAARDFAARFVSDHSPSVSEGGYFILKKLEDAGRISG